MKTLLSSVALLATLSAAPATAATNLIANGSFEQGLAGWTVVNNGQTNSDAQVIGYNQASAYPTGAFGEAVPTDNNTSNPRFDAVGSNFLYLSTDTGNNTLSQTVNLVGGVSYTFGFDYYLPANGYANPNNATLVASLAGSEFARFDLGSQAATTWLYTSAARTFTASQSGAFTLSFSGNGYTAKDVAIDRVFLAPTAAVPEPATWAMMIAGFGLVGGALRNANGRRRKTSVSFA